ncbi:MAG: TIGR00159 family protein [Desulfomonile tiedjei]|nr:TIGR00159 family protein [Desulfomonile tiedjei]
MQSLRELFDSMSVLNVVDILILTALIYFVAAWVKGTRAFQILVTLAGMVLIYFVAARSGLVLTSMLFQYLGAVIIVVLVIVFQPEIREMLDRASPIRFLSGSRPAEVKPEIIDETVRAVAELAGLRIGALIVFRRQDRLDSLMTRGKPLDSLISNEALSMIFQKRSPLHDGAVLIVGERIRAAGCILPLSKDETLDNSYGTRHRAALGLTERSDALCVVVSEERGEVSLVEGRDITNYRKRTDFRQALDRGLALGQTGGAHSESRLLNLVFTNWKLKLISLLIAMALWFAVVGPHSSELGLTVPIQYTNLPAEMEIAGQWMDRVDLRLRGSDTSLANIRPGSVRAVVDLSDVVAGVNFFRITSKNLYLPPGITASEVRPSDLHLNVSVASLKNLPVVPTVIGTLPEKMRVIATPAEVRVKAGQAEMKKVSSVTTDPVNVADLTEKGRITVPVVVKPDGLKIDFVDPMQVVLTLEAEKG